MSNAVATFDLSPQSLQEAFQLADRLSKSNLVPKDYVGKPENILVAIQWGMEIGLKPLQSMQNLAVINGRPAIYGDAMIALCLASPQCEYINETIENGVATCRAKRKGAPEQVRTFSREDAKRAGLLGKQGPWTQYENRMLQMRARGFALRDVFADALKGMNMVEELEDYPQEQTVQGSRVPVAQVVDMAAKSAQELALKKVDTVELEKSIAEMTVIAEKGDVPGLSKQWSCLNPDIRAAISGMNLGLRERAKEVAEMMAADAAALAAEGETNE
jgi:hypothetical protein